MERRSAVGQQNYPVKHIENSRRRLVDCAYDDFASGGVSTEEVDDDPGGVAVQAGGGLVAEQHRRVRDELDGEPHAPALAPGQGAQSRGGAVRQPQVREERVQSLLPLAGTHPAVQLQAGHHLHVLADSEAVDGQVLLGQEPGHLGHEARVHHVPVQEDLTAHVAAHSVRDGG